MNRFCLACVGSLWMGLAMGCPVEDDQLLVEAGSGTESGTGGEETAEPETSTTGSDSMTSAGSLPTTTSEPSTSGGSTDATTTSTTEDAETDTGDETGDTSAGESSGEPVDVACEGPAGQACESPSPYEGPGECDPYAQDCAAGEKCIAVSSDGGMATNTTECRPVAAEPDLAGDACSTVGNPESGEDTCDVGLMCLGLGDDPLTGRCVAQCECGPVEPTCASDGFECVQANAGALAVCVPACDPNDDSSCPPGTGCYPVDGALACLPDVSGDEGAQGEACTGVNTCAPGLMCVAGDFVPGCEGESCCTAYCDVDGDSACPDGLDCESFFGPGEAPQECHLDTGVCVGPG